MGVVKLVGHGSSSADTYVVDIRKFEGGLAKARNGEASLSRTFVKVFTEFCARVA